MPPKKRDPQQETPARPRQTFSFFPETKEVGNVPHLQISKISNDSRAFQEALKQFKTLRASNKLNDAAQRKKEFSKLFSHIETIEADILLLEKNGKQTCGKEKANEFIKRFHNDLGVAFLLNEDYGRARDHFNKGFIAGDVNAVRKLIQLEQKIAQIMRSTKYVLRLMSTQENNEQDMVAGRMYLKKNNPETVSYAFRGPDGVVYEGHLLAKQLQIKEFPEPFIIQELSTPFLIDAILTLASNQKYLQTELDILKGIGQKMGLKNEQIEDDFLKEALVILRHYIQKSNALQEFEELFRLYQNHLEIDDFLSVIRAQNDPTQAAEWFGKLIEFLKKKVNALETDQDNTDAKLRETAQSILKDYLLRGASEKEFENFFMSYQRYFDASHFLLIIDKQDDPDKRAKWLRKLNGFLKKNADTVLDEHMRAYIKQNLIYLANHYVREENYLECFKLLQENENFLSQTQRACYANCFLSTKNILNENILEQACRWLTEAAETGEETAIGLYLDACVLKNRRKFFTPEKNISIVESGLKIETFKAQAHFYYGQFYAEGYGVPKNVPLAIAEYIKAAESGFPQAAYALSILFHKGEKEVDRDLTLAMFYCKKAFDMNLPEAGIFLAEILSEQADILAQADEKIQSSEHALSALKILSSVKKMVESREMSASAKQKIYAQIAGTRSECLWRYMFIQNDFTGSEPIAMDMMQLLEHDLQQALHADDVTKLSATLKLGVLYMFDSSGEGHLQRAEELFQTCLALHKSSDHYNPALEANVFSFLSLLGNMQSDGEKDFNTKKMLQSKALSYYQHALEIEGEAFSTDQTTTLLDDLFNADSSTKSKDYSPLIHSLVHKLERQDPSNWHHQLSALQNKLTDLEKKFSEEKQAHTVSISDLHELTQYIEALGEYLFEAKDLFPQLTEVVDRFVVGARGLDNSSVLSAFEFVGKWHLAECSAALKPLFMHIKYKDLTFGDWSRAMLAFSRCGLSQEEQSEMMRSVLVHLPPDLVTKTKNNSPSLSDISHFLYSLALLDANQPKQEPEEKPEDSSKPKATLNYPALAQQVFTLLEPELLKVEQANVVQISQLYHAHKYFQLKYRDYHWPINSSLDTRFQKYSASLKKVSPGSISNTQRTIGIFLQGIHQEVQQEAFIDEAGRRVDFLFRKRVIPYNGAYQHYYYDKFGKIKFPSARDVLCKATLMEAGYEVVEVSREEWDAVQNNPAKRTTLLKDTLDVRKPAAISSTVEGNTAAFFDQSSPKGSEIKSEDVIIHVEAQNLTERGKELTIT